MIEMRQGVTQHRGYVRWSFGQLLIAFLLLSVTLGVAIGCVIKSTHTLRNVTLTEQQIHRQRRATNKLLTELLNASNQAEMATLQYADNEETERYLTAAKAVDKAVRQLSAEVTDSTQRCRIDSLQVLVWLRRDGTINLINTLRKENKRGDNLQKQIDRLHNEQRLLKVNVDMPVLEQGERVVIERRKRGFFRRLGDAFKRAKDDTISTHVTQHERVVDTTHAMVNIADTMANLLANVHHHLQRDDQLQSRRVYSKSDELRTASTLLSARMTNLIDNFTLEQQRIISDVVSNERRERSSAALVLSSMALLSVIISASLLIWLYRNIKRANHYRTALEEEKLHTEQLMERREQLLLTISHDIKAPINSIIGYLRLLPQDEVQNRNELKAIEASSQHLLHLVMSLLDYHKLEVGGITLHKEATNILQLLHTAFDAFRPIAQNKRLELTFTNDLPCDLSIRTDAFRLRQVVDNLLSNAIKYTAEGQVTLAIWRKGEAQGELYISIQDTGCGLSPHDIDRIFLPFTRVKGSEGQEGTGLGLSITRQLVHLLGGTLHVTSQLNQGSNFTLCLPCTFAKQERQEEGNEPSLTHHSNMSVAIIDDDTLQLQLTEAMLHNVLPQATDVVSFTQPDALFKWLDEGHRPTFLLTDIEMPSLTGYELLHLLRQHEDTSHVPVVAMTSHLLVPISDFKQHGFTDVLFKPFTQNDLIRLFQQETKNDLPAPSGSDATSIVPSSQLSPLLAFAEGDERAEEAILQQFKKDCEQHRTQLQAAISQHDRTTLCKVAHKMLPTFTLISSHIVSTLQRLDAQRDDQRWKEEDGQQAESIINEITHILQDKCLSQY